MEDEEILREFIASLTRCLVPVDNVFDVEIVLGSFVIQ